MLSLPVEPQCLARLQQVRGQVGVLVDAALALGELGQGGHGGHEAARVGLRRRARVAVGVDARARLPVQLLHRLTQERASQQPTLTRSSPTLQRRKGSQSAAPPPPDGDKGAVSSSLLPV